MPFAPTSPRRDRPLLPRLALLVATAVVFAAQTAATAAPTAAPDLQKATFAGGCFWCMEPPYDKLDGVIATISGYTGGRSVGPTYEQVSSGRSGHLEVVQVVFDANQVSYDELLQVFWRNVDPTDAGGQFCDRGEQYTTAIFVHDEDQRRAAEKSRQQLVDSGALSKIVVTPIRELTAFYPAEEYHQDYYTKNPRRYQYYRRGCGRDRVLERLWGDPPSE